MKPAMTPADPALLPALAPCPFCGGPAELIEGHKPFVMCADPNCAAEGPPRTMAKNAIAAWNKRAPPNEAQVEAAKLAIWTSLHDSFSDRQRKVIDFHAYPFNTHNHKELI